jgi:hypothetical protein
VKKCRWGYETDEERMRVTVLLCDSSMAVMFLGIANLLEFDEF